MLAIQHIGIYLIVEILAFQHIGTYLIVEILANQNIGIYLIVVYKLFVSRGRRKRESIFRTCILKNECISMIFESFLLGSGVAASRESIFRTCFWKNEHGTNGNNQFLIKFLYMARQAKPLLPIDVYRNSVLGGGPKVYISLTWTPFLKKNSKS